MAPQLERRLLLERNSGLLRNHVRRFPGALWERREWTF